MAYKVETPEHLPEPDRDDVIQELTERSLKWVNLRDRAERTNQLDAALTFERDLNMSRIDYLLERLHSIDLMNLVVVGDEQPT